MGDGLAIDETARELARNAQATATSAWEGVGKVLREGHDLREEMQDGFFELKRLFLHAIGHFGRATGHEMPSLPPPPSKGHRRAYENGDEHGPHEYGRREYDPEHTHPGSTNLSVDETIWRDTHARLRRLEKKDAEDEREKQRLADEKKGADKLVKKYKRWAQVAAGLGIPSAIAWIVEHWHLLH